MITGKCHCGKTTFRIDGDLPPKLTRCTRSFCASHGVLYAYFKPEQLHVETSTDHVYRWNSKLVAHHSCSECACSVYSDSPAFERDGNWDGKTRRVGVNARLFDGFVADDAEVTVLDGKNLW